MHKGRLYPWHFYCKRVRSQWFPHLVANRVFLRLDVGTYPGADWNSFPLHFDSVSNRGVWQPFGDAITYSFNKVGGSGVDLAAQVTALSVADVGGRHLVWLFELYTTGMFFPYHHTTTCHVPVIDPEFKGGAGHGTFGSCYDTIYAAPIVCPNDCRVVPLDWSDTGFYFPGEKTWHPPP
jgi:hypothetical protein